MTVRSSWHTSPGQTREDTRRAPLGTFTPTNPTDTLTGVILGGNPCALTGASAMTFTISPGRAIAQGTSSQGAYPLVVTAAETLTVAPGNVSNPRIDSVFLVAYDALYDTSGQTTAALVLAAGTPAASPAAPNAPTPSSVRLYDILVPAGASAANGGINWSTAVTDRRVYTAAVGGISVGNTPGAYAGQWRDKNGVLERYDGTAWQPGLTLGASPRLTLGTTSLYPGGTSLLKTDQEFQAATATTTTGVTPATGWAATIQTLRKTAGVSMVTITLNRTGADLGAADGFPTSTGNISPDLTVCTLPAAWRPTEDLYIACSTGIGHGSIRIQADGVCQLLTWQADRTITNGSNLRFTYTFIK